MILTVAGVENGAFLLESLCSFLALFVWLQRDVGTPYTGCLLHAEKVIITIILQAKAKTDLKKTEIDYTFVSTAPHLMYPCLCGA